MKIGSTTVPLAGWVVDPRDPVGSREIRLGAIRKLVQEYALSAVELTLDLGILFPQIFDASFYMQAAELQAELGFTYTVHLPFTWIDPASLNEPIRQTSVDCLLQALELAQPLQVESYTLHLWGETTIQIASLLERPEQQQVLLGFVLAQAERSLAPLCQVVEPERLCIENLEAPDFEFILPLVEKYNSGICLDVGHLAWQEIDPTIFIERYKERIREVHLHDARIEGQTVIDHLPLGQGNLDYLAILKKLSSIGYNGAVILENNSLEDLEQSLEKLNH